MTGPTTTGPTTTVDRSVQRRVARLSQVSAARVLEPDEAVPGDFGPGQILPDDLLFAVALGIALTPEQKATLSREQVASLLAGGIRLEAALMAGFGLMLASWRDLTDPRVTYLLHEVGEETRHSRLFARMIDQLAPQADSPFEHGIMGAIGRRLYRLTVTHPVLLATMVLAGEEIPDLVQRWTCEAPEADEYLRRACSYHREEEARHIAFAGMLLPELWARAGWRDRMLVRYAAPRLISMMMELMFHPGVYATVGLPALPTHRRVMRSALWLRLRTEATRPVLKTLLAAAPELRGRVPRPWRRLAGVDRDGSPAVTA